MKMYKFTITVLVTVLALASTQVMGQDPNTATDSNALPDDFPEFIITELGETAPGYLFGSCNSDDPNIGKYFMILENSGKPIFYSKTQRLGFKLMPNGLFAERTEIKGMKKKYTWYLQDETFAEVDSFQMGNGYLADNHDFRLMPNGHALMFCYDDQIVDMSQIVEGGNPIAKVTGAVIQELDADRNVVFQWRSWDYIPITDTYQNVRSKGFGYIHVNSIEFDELDGNIILSCRETSEVIKISRATGEVMWRMQGKHNEFTFLNEHEENAPRYFKVQHDARRHPTGTLTLFDDGADAKDMTRPYSRGVEYALDEENKTATMVWEFRHDPDFLAMNGGDVMRLPNGNTLIRWGGATYDSGASAATEVDPNGKLVYDIFWAMPKTNGAFARYVWPLESLSTSASQYELSEGNTYVFDEGGSAVTGVTIKVNSYDGDGYNSATVKRTPFAPINPKFPGWAPRVLVVRVSISGSSIKSINAEVSFDVESFGFTNPDTLTVYYRESEGQGMFRPLETSYNPVTKKLRATMNGFGELIFCFPDLAQVALAPILIEPASQGAINQELPVSFFWTPRGFGRSYHLQVAMDAQFDTLVVDDPNITETRYVLESVQPNTTHYWRVCTTNEGGTGDWSTRSFMAVPPKIQVTAPNGGEQWQRGLKYFIRWDDNLAEDVVIELYKGEVLLKTIATASSIGAFEWEVNLELEPGEDYSIKVKSANDDTIFDVSDAPFIITDATETGE